MFAFFYKRNDIDDDVLAPVKMDMTLRKADENLSLYGSGINDSHANLIANRLISCKTIKRVDISGTTSKKGIAIAIKN